MITVRMSMLDESVGRLADAEAAALGEEFVGTHHLLLAVANYAGTVAATALATNGVHLEQFRAALAQKVSAPGPACREGGLGPREPGR
jgi:Clp amino terminal domain, pathogenicity island component